MAPNNFSYSQLNTFLSCQQKYYYHYIEHIPMDSSVKLVRGNAYHDAVCYAYTHTITDHKIPKLDEVMSIYSDAWDNGMNGKSINRDGRVITGQKVIPKKDENAGMLKDNGLKLLEKYYNTTMQDVIPYEVEVRKSCMFNGITLIAYLDLILIDDTVCDHKTVTRKKSQQDLDNDLQSCFYAIAMGKDHIEFEFHEAVDNKALDIVIAPITKTIDDITFAGKIIMGACKQINSGIFIPNPTSFLCNPDYCQYYRSRCRIPGSF